jgi:hypothetical protein
MPGLGGATPDGGGADGGALSSAGAAGERDCGSPTDPHNCGRCGYDCTTLPLVNPERIACVDGQCSYDGDACLPGFAHCYETEGCLDDLTTAAHCGACANACRGSASYCASPSDQTASCVTTCPPELTRCGNQCVDLASNRAHCGQCDQGCSFSNGAARCSTGSCVPAGCYPGYGDCLADEPGCETSLATFDDCGQCGDSCGAAHAVGRCEENECVRTCDPGFDDCDPTAPDCETSLTTAQNCGTCGRHCSGPEPLCQGGICVASCAGNLPDECAGTCVNLETDAGHCGACGASCEPYQACEEGACTPQYVSTSFIFGTDVRAEAIDVAPDGSLVLSLAFSGTADFDPGAGNDQLNSQGADVVLAKLNANGSHAWSRVIGAPGQDNAGTLALTPSGAVVASLGFSDSIDLDPTDGVDMHGAPGATRTAAVVKLEADGSFAWARSFPAAGEPGLASSDHGRLITDQTGAVYVTGSFVGELQLERGQPAVATAETPTSFLLKLTEGGALAWFHVLEGCDSYLGQPLVDSNGGLWIGGALKGSCLMATSDDESAMVSLGQQSAMLVSWNALTGAFMSGRLEATLRGIFPSAAAGSSAGYFAGWVDQRGTSALLKTDAAGETQWSWSRDDLTLGAGMAATPDEGLLVVGNVSRGKGPMPQGLLIARMDQTGASRWSLNLPTRYGYVHAVDATSSHFLVVGSTHPDLDLDPGESDLFATEAGVFISRYAF